MYYVYQYANRHNNKNNYKVIASIGTSKIQLQKQFNSASHTTR